MISRLRCAFYREKIPKDSEGGGFVEEQIKMETLQTHYRLGLAWKLKTFTDRGDSFIISCGDLFH